MKYELVLMIKPSLTEEQLKKTVGNLKETIANQGGKVENEDLMGKRKLAYEMKKLQEAYFQTFEVEGSQDFPKKIVQKLNVQPEVVRFMVEKRK